MKYCRIKFLLLFLLNASLLYAQNFTPTDQDSRVKFIIKNFGFNTSGTFEGLEGSIAFNPAKPQVAFFDVSVDAKTINTGIEARDTHLKKAEYFNVMKFPKINLKSTKIDTGDKTGTFNFSGLLTIKGITKEVNFPFTAIPKNNGYLFEGTFRLNRRDFEVGGESFSMSDELTVDLSVFARKN
jgi:polyisoprenoid-binding protein YceI